MWPFLTHMTGFPRHALLAAIACLIVLAFPGAEVRAQQPAPAAALVEKLKTGGYNLYVRHAATNWNQRDQISKPGDWTSCDGSKVRQLSEQGRQDGRDLGTALDKLGIRIGQVFASPYCRTMETARLISGKEPEPTEDLMNMRSASFVGGRDAVVARARAKLSLPPAGGVNDLFSAHGNVAGAATGQSLAEGQFLVIAPRGSSKFGIEGKLSLSELEALATP